MKFRPAATIMLALLVGLGAFTGLSLASSHQAKPTSLRAVDPAVPQTAIRASDPRPIHQVKKPSTGAVDSLGTARVSYYESNYYTLASGKTDDFYMNCPAGMKAVTGYYGANYHGLLVDASTVGNSLREWDFGVANLSTTTIRYFSGIVCTRGL